MAKHSSHIIELAKRGAEARLQDLIMEATLLVRLFPDLKDSFDRDELPISFILAKNAKRVAKGKGSRRGKLSATARNAVSQRMKKYWAERRKAKAKVK